MAHQYRLTYFDGRGRGETIRQLFKLAGVPYEDVRVPFDKWPELKPKMPFEQLPLLEVDGHELAQTDAIARFVARKFGFAGKTPFEEAVVDSLSDTYKDLFSGISSFYTAYYKLSSGDPVKLKAEVLVPTATKFFGFFTKFLKKHNSGFLVGNSVTYADLHLAEFTQNMEEWAPEVLKNFPEIVAHKKQVQAIPAIKHWLETRPKTIF